jgi:two-component system, response regulator PdtaR
MTSLRILVVEDDAFIAMVLGQLLTTMGHEVCDTSATQSDAVAAAARLKPDLMIVDGGLRQGSGISAVEEITRTGPIPHFFLSGNCERISAARPDSIILRKPFRLNELSRAIDTAMVTHGVVPTLAGPSLKQSYRVVSRM